MEGKYLDDNGEERQARGDALLDERGGKYYDLDDSVKEWRHWKMPSRMREKQSGGEVFLPGWQCGRGPGIVRWLTKWEWREVLLPRWQCKRTKASEDAEQNEREQKNLFLDENMEEGQALEDAQRDESEMEVLLSGLQGRREPGIGGCLTGWEWKESILTWMTVWKKVRNKEIHNRMRVKGKYSYLDDSVEEGQELRDA
jgi:hypothetical protein